MNQAEGRSLWRELVTEPDTTIVADALIDLYIDRGQRALNDLINYHITDDSTNITFVSGTQDYSLQADCIKVLWVEWNSVVLNEADAEHFRRNYTEWRQTTAGSPTDWFVFGRSISFWPKPNTTTPKPILRYVSTPTAYSSTAFNQLCSQHHEIPVYFAAAEWLTAHGLDSNFARANQFRDLFAQRAAGAKAHYDWRKVGK